MPKWWSPPSRPCRSRRRSVPEPWLHSSFGREGLSLDEVVAKTGRARSNVSGYLCEYLQAENVTDPSPWFSPEAAAAIVAALAASEDGRLKPVFEALDGKYNYEEIRVVKICHHNSTVVAH